MGSTTETQDRLREAAEDARENAYVPRSGRGFGAAILTDDGDIYAGATVQSMISGLGTCAERNAVGNAASAGAYRFDTILVASPFDEPVKPCGACLQVLAEFTDVADHDIRIIMVGRDGSSTETTVRSELPDAYGPRKAGYDISDYE